MLRNNASVNALPNLLEDILGQLQQLWLWNTWNVQWRCLIR